MLMVMKNNKLDRYQYQPWYIKFLRSRYLVLVPYYTIKTWIKYPKECTFTTLWLLYISLAHCKMNYVYDLNEVLVKND
jgi:hypothetical protein